jgi:transposase-like protein
MNSVQESKNELEASIRYAENAISSAKQTIESMEFRQEMAQKQYSEKTGREQALERDLTVKTSQAEAWRKEYEKAKKEADELRSKVQGQYDDIVMLEREVEVYTKKYNELVKQKEASSGPCGCQAYRDLEEKVATMPVIPKAVAIAIFREGTLFGVEAACDEIQGESINISESDYVGDFSITFERDIDLDDHIDFDWVRSKIGDYDEDNVTANLEGLCAKNNFECRIHGIDDQEENKND